MATLERVQKILAKAGIASRRRAEDMILEGLVTINGKVAKLGDKAQWGRDAIKVAGKLLHQVETPVYILFNKPKGVLSTLSDPEGRPTLKDYLSKVKSRVFPVGRLDFNSEGALILTNDGEMAESLQKCNTLLRVYHIKIRGHLDELKLERLRAGARIGSRVIAPYLVRSAEKYAKKSLIEFALIGSGAVDVKAYFEKKGLLVERMVGHSIGHVDLSGLKPGEMKYLKLSQVQALLKQPELGIQKLENDAKDLPKRTTQQEKKFPLPKSRGRIIIRPSR